MPTGNSPAASNWGSTAGDPETGMLYVTSVHAPFIAVVFASIVIVGGFPMIHHGWNWVGVGNGDGSNLPPENGAVMRKMPAFGSSE